MRYPRFTMAWYSWFAWKPVKTDCGTWVWMETIKRYNGHNWTAYSLPTNWENNK